MNTTILKDAKIVYINLGNYGSTGKIISDISDLAEKKGAYTYKCYPQERYNVKSDNNDYIISNNLYLKINRKIAIYTGKNGGFNILATYKLLQYLKKISPDIIHLHNLHNSYINLNMLFKFIKNNNIKVVWTLHDCWAFTGHCAHYTLANCDGWRNECIKCEHYKDYPYGIFDNAHANYKRKKNMFCGIKDLIITVPSNWLSQEVSKSYLSEYTTCVINNGIDTDIFKPTKGDFVERYGLQNYKVILGVSFDWTEKKGIDVFCNLADKLPEDYKIVLVGESQDKILPNNIIQIPRTNNRKELAEIYTSAYVFVNPTKEEVFGLVNAEALACGTPVITFNTGGCPEILDEASGYVCNANNEDEIIECLKKIEKRYPSSETCRKRAEHFDYRLQYKEYIELYEKVLK